MKKIVIIDIKEKARRIRVQTEHERETKVDHERRDREGSEERGSRPRKVAELRLEKREM